MRRAILSSSIGLGVTAALLVGCHTPMPRISQFRRAFENAGERPPPMAPAATQAAPSIMESDGNEVAFYDLVEAFGLDVSIDLVTGRRECSDAVNRVIVTPSARSITVNGREHALEASIRWRDGTLVLPGGARTVLAMHLRPVPLPEVESDPELFDGRELTLGAERGSATTRPAAAPRARGAAETSLPSAWRVAGRRGWQYIVLHHSATGNGGAESFGREHQRKWPNGLGYHFVIGNGTDTRDGEVEVGPRWLRQGEGIDGAHAGNERYNKQGIGVCLVGDFNGGGRPTPAQLVSLRRLCRALMQRYGISGDRIYPHCDVRRGHTDCPGKNFPFQSFVSSL